MEYNLGNVHRDMKTGTVGIVAGVLFLLGWLVSIALPALAIFAIIHFARKFW